MDLKVITPVKTFSELPESSAWQPVYQKLYGLIQAHQTTLVFAGMRAQTEKIARALNQLHRQITGDPAAELALAHHGSSESDLALPQTLISETLNRMLAEKQVVHGRLIEGRLEEQWCDRHNFTRLYRTAVSRRRTVQHPADRNMFNRFLLQWHHMARPGQPWQEIIQRLSVYRDLSQHTWQLMVNRLRGYLTMPYPIKPVNRIEIHQINNLPAAKSPLAKHLLETGFEKDGARLVLWPSAV